MDDKTQFITLEANNGKGHIIGMDNICITLFIYIENVLLVDRLKHNLLSISQNYVIKVLKSLLNI